MDSLGDMDSIRQLLQLQALERMRMPRGWVHPNVRPSDRRRPTVHQLKVTLKEVKPPIWRRIVVPSNYFLDEVAEMIIEAMGWYNTHLHAFFIGELRYDMVGPFSEGDELDEARFRLRDVFSDVGRSARFEYDFGDGWEHTVLLEAVRLQTKAEQEPYCLAGRRACPPEDCGGPHGFLSLLELRDKGPVSEWDRERLEWLGDFDPTAFSVDEATHAMQNPVGAWD